MKYRSDIDGLRSIAVLPVVLFHAGFDFFSGGYVGVDVFFVISGYLITRILNDEINQNSFSLAGFYERRIRRIFPALFAMIGICCVAGYWLMMPRDFSDFAKSVVASSLSASNMLFWWQAGYFDGAAEAKPLLHTWSLAVEEQFYILFPLILWSLHRWVPMAIARCLAGLAVLSFGLCVASLWISPISGFYFAPLRAWELLVGSLLALGRIPAIRSQTGRDLVSLAGLAGIVAAVLVFDAQTPFPGYAALLPVLGAAAIIHAGEHGPSFAGRMLGTRLLVGIGLISYSLYLWHWPALVFAEYYTIDELTSLQSLAAVAGALVLAYLSWRFVEKPFRSSRGLIASPKGVYAGGAGAVLCSVLAAALILGTDGAPQRFSPEVRAVLASSESLTDRMTECSGKIELQLRAGSPCAIGNAARPAAFVWGDSHADALTGALQAVSEKTGIGFYYGVDASCPPLVGIGTDRACIAANERRLEFLKQHPEVTTVVLASRWTSYIQGRAVDFGPAESNEQLPGLMTAEGRYLGKFSAGARRQFAAGLNRAIHELLKAGKKVVVVYPIPETGYNIPTTIARKLVKGEAPESFTRPVDYYWKRHGFTLQMLDALPYGANLIAVEPRLRLCDERQCRVFAEGSALYWDDDHLSLEGARFISSLFDKAITGAAPRGTL